MMSPQAVELFTAELRDGDATLRGRIENGPKVKDPLGIFDGEDEPRGLTTPHSPPTICLRQAERCKASK